MVFGFMVVRALPILVRVVGRSSLWLKKPNAI